jgi:hypothetical protein
MNPSPTMKKNWSEGATAYRDINPAGPMSHDLPHSYLPLTGYDRRTKDVDTVNGMRVTAFMDDDGTCCQFTAGGQRCQGTLREHRMKFPEWNS